MPVLVCILLYSVSVLVSNFARGWRDEKQSSVRRPHKFRKLAVEARRVLPESGMADAVIKREFGVA